MSAIYLLVLSIVFAKLSNSSADHGGGALVTTVLTVLATASFLMSMVSFFA